MYRERYLITGGSGFIGSVLVKQLLEDDQDVTVLTRDSVKTANHFADLMQDCSNKVRTINDLDSLNPDVSFDVVVNLAGQGIADRRWTDAVKQQLLDSRLNTTQAVCDYLKEALVKPDVFISASALGYYGFETDDALIDETASPDDSFSSQLCVAWEKQAACIEDLGIRTCYLRTGVVLGHGGGALTKMLPAFKWGLGGRLGDGQQWMSWIHRDDIVAMIRYLVEHTELQGAFNGTAPSPVRNNAFTKIMGKVLRRPTWLPMPAFALRFLLGEMAEQLLLSGKRVVPKKFLAAGYQFKYPDIESALREILKPARNQS